MKPHIPPPTPVIKTKKWVARKLNCGNCCIELDSYSMAVFTGDDGKDCCHTLPADEFIIDAERAKRIVAILNESKWEDS